jgi:hypothetical protein
VTFSKGNVVEMKNVDWLIDYFLFYVPLKNISLLWRRHQCRWRAAKFRPMLGAQDPWAERDLYRATPAVTRDLGFSGLIRKTAPISRLVRHTWGCGGSILTWILTGTLSFISTTALLWNLTVSVSKVQENIHGQTLMEWDGLYKET